MCVWCLCVCECTPLSRICDSGNESRVLWLEGKMADCPAYLGVSIYQRNLVEVSELMRYDLLVLCPPDFNLTATIPDTELFDLGDLQQPRTLEVRFEDGHRNTHRVFLTQVTMVHL
jgi:hypothetical protein